MTQFVLNKVLTVANNLRFNDDNGNLVTQMYAINPIEGQPDTPSTGYISLIGSRLSSMINDYNSVLAILDSYNTRISTLETDVQDILTSGATAIPQVNGGCLNGNTNDDVDVVTGLLVASECSYITALGSTSALASAVTALDTSALNVLPSYSIPGGVMQALSGWISSPATSADLMNNLALAYLDMRVGVTQALSQSAITCSSININISSAYNSSTHIITLYFPGSSIPANFTDNGSNLLVEDSAGNQFTMNFDVITAVVNDGFLAIDITASTLLQTSNYTVTFNYDVISTTPSLGCANTKIVSVTNNTVVCPNVSTWSTTTTVSYTFVPPVTTNVTYTVDLLDVSGTPVIGATPQTYTDPATPVTGTFTNLTTATSYNVRVTVDVSGVQTICSLNGITTQ
jgi:hypothetical protein